VSPRPPLPFDQMAHWTVSRSDPDKHLVRLNEVDGATHTITWSLIGLIRHDDHVGEDPEVVGIEEKRWFQSVVMNHST